MAETATADVQTPSTPAPLETPERDWSKLNDLIGDEESTETEIPAKEAEASSAAPAATDETPEELKALDALLATETPEPAEAEAPKVALTPELQQIDQLKADPVLAKDVLGAARSMIQLENAIHSGDMNQVVGLFDTKFQSALENHFIERMSDAATERIVKRYVKKMDPTFEFTETPENPKVAQLEAKLATIEGTLTERQKKEQALEQQARTQAQQQSYTKYWDALFKAGNVTDQKQKSLLRGWVLDSIAESARSGDNDARKAMEQIRAGRYAPIGIKFREVFPEWIKDQKAKTTTDTSIRNAQDQKQTGKLGTTPAETTVAANADYDADGKRTKGFWERNLKKLGLD